MSIQSIIEQSAPTLAGIKTGSLFPLKKEKGEDIRVEIRKLNRILRKKGLCMIPLHYGDDRTLIYLYRPSHLKRDLSSPEAEELLKEKGYTVTNPSACLARLARQFSTENEFPHEIGLFLGYPPEDVCGFIRSPKDGVKCVGYWKVYGNKEEAEHKFQKYRSCTNSYRQAYLSGISLLNLLVADQ